MIVYKFGGASVKNAEGVRNLLNIVRGENELFIIVSAMGKTTNALEKVFEAFRVNNKETALNGLREIREYHYSIIVNLWNEEKKISRVENFLKELEEYITEDTFDTLHPEMVYDKIVAYGELISTSIVSEFLNNFGVRNSWIDMRTCLLTQSRHKDANVLLEESTPRLRRQIAGSEDRVFVGQGFIGSAEDGSTTTLGREGSDYSAAVVANILDASCMSVWKDVDGILNADPKVFPNARKIDKFNYVDAIELSYSGAQIIHPKTIKPLQNKNIPLYVRPFSDKSAQGTVILGEAPQVNTPIIIFKQGQCLIRLRSKDLSFVLEEKFPIVFSLLERYRIKTNLIHNTAVELDLCTEHSWHLDELKSCLESEGFEVNYVENAELLTIRNYQSCDFEEFASRDFLIRQTTPTVVRVVRKSN